MSNDAFHRSFRQFCQTINHWPAAKIEKKTVLNMLERVCHQDENLVRFFSELHKEENVSSSSKMKNVKFSAKTTTENSFASFSAEKNGNNSTDVLIKEGELTVRKGSAILSPLLKALKIKSHVYAEITYKQNENETLRYFIIYKNRKHRKLIEKFVIDENCSFVFETKQDFKFEHSIATEHFTTETGTADAWITALNSVLNGENMKNDEVDENPDDFETISGSSSENVLDIPIRIPPRPVRPEHIISPTDIYVCLYDHQSISNDPYELEFNCGDLLCIINREADNFYIGYRLTLPRFNDIHGPIGYVFKEYIEAAYEKILM